MWKVGAIATIGVSPWCLMAVQQGALGRNKPYVVTDPDWQPYEQVRVHEGWLCTTVAAKTKDWEDEELGEMGYTLWSPCFLRPVKVIYLDKNGNEKPVDRLPLK
jgi:hypothetical protein